MTKSGEDDASTQTSSITSPDCLNCEDLNHCWTRKIKNFCLNLNVPVGSAVDRLQRQWKAMKLTQPQKSGHQRH